MTIGKELPAAALAAAVGDRVKLYRTVTKVMGDLVGPEVAGLLVVGNEVRLSLGASGDKVAGEILGSTVIGLSIHNLK